MNTASYCNPIPSLQKALHQHQSDLFQRYSKILMIRTDFHWAKKTDRYRYQDDHQFTADMTFLMLQLSETPGVIGYAWVIEDALDRGLHAHGVIYVNGQQHCKKWAFGERIGDLWYAVTEGEGQLYHCLDKSDYRASIALPVHYGDRVGRQAMRYVVNYLAKAEQKGHQLIYTISTLPTYQPTGRPRCCKRHTRRSQHKV